MSADISVNIHTLFLTGFGGHLTMHVELKLIAEVIVEIDKASNMMNFDVCLI